MRRKWKQLIKQLRSLTYPYSFLGFFIFIFLVGWTKKYMKEKRKTLLPKQNKNIEVQIGQEKSNYEHELCKCRSRSHSMAMTIAMPTLDYQI